MTHIEVDRVRPTELDSRFRGNDIALRLFSVMPALRLRSGQAPAGIQDLLLLRVNANEIRSRKKALGFSAEETEHLRLRSQLMVHIARA